MSARPCSSRTVAARRSTSSGRRMSTTTASALSPTAVMASTRSLARWSSISATTTWAPAPASASETAPPMPPPPPVTTATRPVRSMWRVGMGVSLQSRPSRGTSGRRASLALHPCAYDLAMLQGVRVVDRTTEISGPYCTKLLADAGADVVKVEPGDGDPLRRWHGGGLFEYLNTSKRSVVAREDDPTLADLTDLAVILVADRPVDLPALWRTNPSLVVVTITPFGCDGPWAHRPATEFTVQAACGSTGSRGLPENPPLAAGGRLGEWITGTYAAIGAVGALRSAQRGGQGEHVDVALFDCMAVTMTTYPSVFAEFMCWPRLRGTGRTIEVPSIEPTADGYVAFTTNSAQQFENMLVMIGRGDLLEDTDLARAVN